MDSMIAAAARALAAGDALGGLKLVALRADPAALALRGIAMAQLGDYARSRELLKRAARAFGAHEELARARCVVAEAEVALAMRDLRGSTRALAEAADALGPAALHPAGVVQERLHALHLRDVLVERPRRGEAGRELGVVRVEPRVELGAEVGDRPSRILHSYYTIPETPFSAP